MRGIRGAVGAVGPAWHHAGVPAAPVPPTSRLRVVTGEEELLRSRAVSAVRAAVLERHPDAELHELAAQGLPTGQLADVLAPSLFGGHRLVIVTGVHESAAALAEALTADQIPDERTAALCTLLCACRMEPALRLPPEETARAHQRLEDIASGAGFSGGAGLEDSIVRPSVALVVATLGKAIQAALGTPKTA